MKEEENPRIPYGYTNDCEECGEPITDKSRFCKSCVKKGERNPNWKMGVGMVALHDWVRRNKTPQLVCEDCNKGGIKLELANISGKYKRDIDDFKWICRSCHSKMDYPDGLVGKNFKKEKKNTKSDNYRRNG